VRLDDAASLDATGFQDASEKAYLRLATELARHQAAEPVRIWNFLPGILEPLGSLPHRYMAFNTARHDAYLHLYGTADEVAHRAPAASGVGHPHPSLILHCLAARMAGRSIENPRQTPACQYSRRHGPQPPCFARATLLDQDPTPRLLVGGTASIVGEDTVHPGDLTAQLTETVRNIESLLRAAAMDGAGACVRKPQSLRVYFVHAGDEALLRRLVPAHFDVPEIEYVRAQLCRPELLVEIEAVYHQPRGHRGAAR